MHSTFASQGSLHVRQGQLHPPCFRMAGEGAQRLINSATRFDNFWFAGMACLRISGKWLCNGGGGSAA